MQKYYDDKIISENEYQLEPEEEGAPKGLYFFIIEKIEKIEIGEKSNYEEFSAQEFIEDSVFGIVLNLNQNIVWDMEEFYTRYIETYIVDKPVLKKKAGDIRNNRRSGPQYSTTAYLKCASSNNEIQVAKDYYEKVSNARTSRKQKKQKDEEQRLEAIKQQEEMEKYLESSEGKLVSGYMNYIILKKFNDARQGYEVVYITNQQMNDVKNKIKEIENTLTSQEKIDTDAAWQKAQELYKDNFVISTLVDTVQDSGGITNDAMSIAKMTLVEFNDLHKKVTGGDKIEKDF